ncbi:aminotransferase class III-fold pyridoxal phosphate-dependent enzyme [Nocardioides mangrovicus]|uniref:Aminotransferase class III-fold pyridoxal phosphate-dependent enzyme n=1 Tax=Nocardioides mangrovicus TaxID=2478913 RepID=A0A3L8NZD5_9ACTN|nr:aminotransferase class III-fold pyridoxal phosphate-dependent enzyme [Nocardioides mangrovicus]RLV47913.1 aminotransferase class III-fold pyridoxal phosphate-dependent enzyme [Nocardioides mangrovicus]
MSAPHTRAPRVPQQRAPLAPSTLPTTLPTTLPSTLPTTLPSTAFRPAFAPQTAPLPGPTTRVHDRGLSQVLSTRLDALVPGGAATAARGSAAYPAGRAPVLTRGQGGHVWDVDGNRYVELGSGDGAVALGHRHPRVADAVRAALEMGESFTRPAALEVDAAETLLACVPQAEMVAFVGDDAAARALAVDLARTLTGRDPVVVLPSDDLASRRAECDTAGSLLVLDERRTAFRITPGGATLDVPVDLRLLGGALGNGFAVGAVTGSRAVMRHARVEQGAQAHALAAATAVLEAHRKEDVVATLDWVGRYLAEQVREALDALGLVPHLRLTGPPADLRYTVLDGAGEPSADLQRLFLAGLLDHGVLAPSFVVSAALTDADVQHVADGAHQAAQGLRLALDDAAPR